MLVAQVFCKRMYTSEQLQEKSLPQLKKIGYELNVLPESDRRCRQSWIDAIVGVNPPLLQLLEVSPGVEVEQAQDAIVPATKNLPGSRSKASTAHQLLELFKSSAHSLEDSPGVKTQATAIAPVAKNYLEEESDQNPILTGIPLSDRFVTRYTPPQPEIIHFQSDADGQLSLLDFEVESVEEPPDPDDFESLNAFREAIALWDAQNPESPAVSIDSMCEWAPCLEEWYEPEAEILPLKASSMIELPEQSEVMELPPLIESSITSDFFIPTFGFWGDRESDEPPDTGVFAKVPGPKPPKFPPRASQPNSGQVSPASRNNPETIPKQFHRVVAGSSNQPARSPPGGDAGF